MNGRTWSRTQSSIFRIESTEAPQHSVKRPVLFAPPSLLRLVNFSGKNLLFFYSFLFFWTNLREDWNSGHWITSCPLCHPTWIHLSVHFFRTELIIDSNSGLWATSRPSYPQCHPYCTRLGLLYFNTDTCEYKFWSKGSTSSLVGGIRTSAVGTKSSPSVDEFLLPDRQNSRYDFWPTQFAGLGRTTPTLKPTTPTTPTTPTPTPTPWA